MKLFEGRSSSASWRVRWALALKGLPYQSVMIDIAQGEHFRVLDGISPLCTVPTLEIAEGQVLSESVAIIEWLDEQYPTPRLLPEDAWLRARVRELVQLVNADIHPLQNTIVRLAIGDSEADQAAWARKWIERGLAAYERRVADFDGPYSVGETLTMADLFLLPQFVNAERYGVDVTAFPRVSRICAACLATPAAAATHPARVTPPR